MPPDEPDATSNVTVVRAVYDALSRDDAGAVRRIWHPEGTYWVHDAHGEPQRYPGGDGFLRAMAQRCSGSSPTTQVLDARPVGSRLVVCHVRCNGESTGETRAVEVAQVLQIEDGQITYGAELGDGSAVVPPTPGP